MALGDAYRKQTGGWHTAHVHNARQQEMWRERLTHIEARKQMTESARCVESDLRLQRRGRTFRKSTCRLKKTFGCTADAKHLWVAEGCRGVFHVPLQHSAGRKPWWMPEWQLVTCPGTPERKHGRVNCSIHRPPDASLILAGERLPQCRPMLPAHSGLRVVQARGQAVSFRMAVMGSDFVGQKMAAQGFWEIRHPDDLTTLAADWKDTLAGTLNAFRPRPDVIDGQRGLFIDIGTHVGFYSFLFAAHNYSVLAIEPMPRNRLAITATLCLNPHLGSRITLVPTAIGLRRATCVLRAFHEFDGNGELDCTANATCRDTRPADDYSDHPCARRICVCDTVTSMPLDEVLSAHVPDKRRYSTIVAKVDVEGHECQVLESGKDLFRRLHVDYLQMELLRPASQRCFRWQAAAHGYEIGAGLGHDNNTVMRRGTRRRGAGGGSDWRARTTAARLALTAAAEMVTQ